MRQRRLRAREAGRGWLGWVGKEGRGEPVFTRVLQDIEGHCLGCVRRVLQSEGWPARSWQQEGMLEEDANEWKAAGLRGGAAAAASRLCNGSRRRRARPRRWCWLRRE